MSSAREQQSDTYFAANLPAILARSQSWQSFKKVDLDFPDPETLNLRPARPVTYADRVRLLALNVLLVAKLENEAGWSRGRYARFWCEIAGVNHERFQRVFKGA